VWNFYLFAAVAVLGLVATGLVPVADRQPATIQLREQTP
jgi:AAHS family benzoate transporter-like MFS transporter